VQWISWDDGKKSATESLLTALVVCFIDSSHRRCDVDAKPTRIRAKAQKVSLANRLSSAMYLAKTAMRPPVFRRDDLSSWVRWKTMAGGGFLEWGLAIPFPYLAMI
jgi:hypothetical protein